MSSPFPDTETVLPTTAQSIGRKTEPERVSRPPCATATVARHLRHVSYGSPWIAVRNTATGSPGAASGTVVIVPLPPAVARTIGHAVACRARSAMRDIAPG